MLTTTQPAAPHTAPTHHQRLETARTTRFNHAPRPDSWRPPNHAIDPAPPNPDAPLAHIDPDRLAELMNAVLEDWDTPGFTELGLCRAHQITLDQTGAEGDQPSDRPQADAPILPRFPTGEVPERSGGGGGPSLPPSPIPDGRGPG